MSLQSLGFLRGIKIIAFGPSKLIFYFYRLLVWLYRFSLSKTPTSTFIFGLIANSTCNSLSVSASSRRGRRSQARSPYLSHLFRWELLLCRFPKSLSRAFFAGFLGSFECTRFYSRQIRDLASSVSLSISVYVPASQYLNIENLQLPSTGSWDLMSVKTVKKVTQSELSRIQINLLISLIFSIIVRSFTLR